MQKRWMNQALLAAVLLVLGSVSYWYEYSHKPKKEEADSAKKNLFSLKDKSIQSIRLVTADGAFAFGCAEKDKKECKPGGQADWELIEPRKLPADKSHVNSLLSALSNASSNDEIDLSQDAPAKRTELLEKQYGLGEGARKSASIRKAVITLEDGQSQSLFLGDVSPIGDKIFAVASQGDRLLDERVVLLASYFKSHFEHDLNYWRDKRVYDVESRDVSSFVLKTSKGQVRGGKKEGLWTLDGEFEGDADHIDTLIRGFANLNAEAVVADDQKDSAFRTAVQGAKEEVSIRFSIEKEVDKKPVKTEHEIVFLKKKDKVFANPKGNAALYEFKDSVLSRFEKGLKDLRVTKLISSSDRFTAKKLVFEGMDLGTAPLVLSNENSKWKQTGTDKKIDEEKVTKLLDRLNGNRIKDFIAEAQAPSGREKGITLTLGDEKTADLRKLLFWKNKEDLFGKDLKSQRKEAFKLENNLKDSLPWKADFFEDQKLDKSKKKTSPKKS